jgi:hypothetical protein
MNPTIPVPNTIYDPELSDVLDLHKKDVMLSINCHAIATIQSFDPAAGTVTASINYQRTYFYTDPNSGQYVPQLVSYPLLLDVPVLVLGGGNSALTFPIQKGDQALILFNDRAIDNWMAGARSGPVSSSRTHSLADGLALVGLNAISSYDADNVTLDGGSALIQIKNEMTNLKTVLFDLITAINAMTVTGTPGITPLPVSGVPGSINTEIASLLK